VKGGGGWLVVTCQDGDGVQIGEGIFVSINRSRRGQVQLAVRAPVQFRISRVSAAEIENLTANHKEAPHEQRAERAAG
jgi:sRNA-binding carbon storage regulator CsrA